MFFPVCPGVSIIFIPGIFSKSFFIHSVLLCQSGSPSTGLVNTSASIRLKLFNSSICIFLKGVLGLVSQQLGMNEIVALKSLGCRPLCLNVSIPPQDKPDINI